MRGERPKASGKDKRTGDERILLCAVVWQYINAYSKVQSSVHPVSQSALGWFIVGLLRRGSLAVDLGEKI